MLLILIQWQPRFQSQSIYIKTRQLFKSNIFFQEIAIFFTDNNLSSADLLDLLYKQAIESFKSVIYWCMFYGNGGDNRQCIAKHINILCLPALSRLEGYERFCLPLSWYLENHWQIWLWCEVRKGLVETNKDKLRC